MSTIKGLFIQSFTLSRKEILRLAGVAKNQIRESSHAEEQWTGLQRWSEASHIANFASVGQSVNDEGSQKTHMNIDCDTIFGAEMTKLPFFCLILILVSGRLSTYDSKFSYTWRVGHAFTSCTFVEHYGTEIDRPIHNAENPRLFTASSSFLTGHLVSKKAGEKKGDN